MNKNGYKISKLLLKKLIWAQSPQGFLYWRGVYLNLRNLESLKGSKVEEENWKNYKHIKK